MSRLLDDLQMLSRRRWLGVVAKGAAAITVFGCGDNEGPIGPPDATRDVDGNNNLCAKIPEETAGPYPGDGTNGANALALAGIVRSDIRSSFDGPTGVADGVPLTVTLTVVNAATCAPLAGYAVYLWHCDRDGNYSMYSPATVTENYLRGVQVSDANGQVTFTTIFAGCYPGRWPHIHFEVFPSLSTSAAGKIATSQLAFPKPPCDEVYASAGYAASATALAPLSLATDGVFEDGYAQQLATVTGSVVDGYAATLRVSVTV